MYFSKSLYKPGSSNESAMKGQFNALNQRRAATNHHIADLTTNAGRSPQDLYREFDTMIVEQFRLDEGDAILNALLPLSRSVNIGRTIVEYARASDSGVAQTSMSGSTGIKFDGLDYDYGGTYVPVHDVGFELPWRQYEAQRLEGFDEVMDLQRESARTLRQRYVSFLLDGSAIKYKGKTWSGFRSDSTVKQVDLGAGGLNVDFTSSALTGANFRNGWLELVKKLYLEEKVTVPATYFVSNQIFFNAQRFYTDNYASGTILDQIKRVVGVADVVPSSALTGNQVLAMPLSQSFIEPVVGMGVNTVALSRPEYNSPYRWVTWGAMGIMVKNDFGGTNTGVMYAAS